MLPLDESAYDYHVSRESWLGFVAFLKSVFPSNEAVTLFESYFLDAKWEFDGKSGQWLSGMPSGLALTSFLNSWMNYIKQTVVTPGFLAYAAGDDVCVAPFVAKTLDTIAADYARFGSELNASKNWYSSKYTEYLKTIFHKNGTTGYPARIYASLIWAGVDRTFLPSDRLPELAELFKQFYDRLGQPMDEDLVASDLARAVSHKVRGFNKVAALKWLHSPKAYGGFGKLPYNDFNFIWETEVLRRDKWTNVLVRVPEINFYSDKVDLKINKRRLALGKRVYFGPTLRLEEITNLQEWEARLNGEDNPVKGQFGKMALDVIPLPTIDMISTSNMSALASHFELNVYPQLRGASDTILDRLVVASIILVQLVTQFMTDNRLTELSN